MRHSATKPFRRILSTLVFAALTTALGMVPESWAQTARPATVKAAPESGPKWSELSPTQRNSLRPLERDWATIDADRKEKWIEIAQRIPTMNTTDRERIQARMTEWARLSPTERGQARIGYQQAKQVAPKDRQAQWEAYQALTAEQKRQLQAKAVPAPSAPKRNGQRGDRLQRKSNIVPSSDASPPKSVGPTIVQAQPGATTSLISRRPTPPAHQHTGLPKIAATPEFVDKATLLPRRGPQAAATRPVPASSPTTRP